MTWSKRTAAYFAVAALAAGAAGFMEVANGRPGWALAAGFGAGGSTVIALVEWLLADVQQKGLT